MDTSSKSRRGAGEEDEGEEEEEEGAEEERGMGVVDMFENETLPA